MRNGVRVKVEKLVQHVAGPVKCRLPGATEMMQGRWMVAEGTRHHEAANGKAS